LLGSGLASHYGRTLEKKGAWSVPLRLWQRLPGTSALETWLGYRVFDPSTATASEVLGRLDFLDPKVLEPTTGYSLSVITRLVLLNTLEAQKPRRILELGGGVSTLIFAAYAARRGGDASIWSIDHDAGWLDQTRQSLEEAGLAGPVRLIHAPLAEREIGGIRCTAYLLPDSELEEHSGSEGFDSCFIDGPPAAVGRGPCLPLVAPYLAPGATILLDDALRPDEQAAWNDWLRRYPGRLGATRLLLTDRGLLVGRWSAGAPARRLADGAALQPVR
jgi:predicted O-methyltransferase YrrM